MIDRDGLKKRVAECKKMIELQAEHTDGDRAIYAALCGMQDIMTPIAAEIEGGGHTWFFACGECHGAIDSNDKYCRHCGCAISWV